MTRIRLPALSDRADDEISFSRGMHRAVPSGDSRPLFTLRPLGVKERHRTLSLATTHLFSYPPLHAFNMARHRSVSRQPPAA